jgi:hypothetical protein
MMMAAVLALQVVSSAAADPARAACTAADDVALARAAELIERGDDPLIHEPALQPAAGSTDGCAAIALARLALLSWAEARALAVVGGDPAQLGPMRARLDEFGRFAPGPLALDAEYARVAVQAAVAAAQDERGELELLLTHARDLSERLIQRGRPARWPRPFNLLAGELWLEVDRFEDARQAFERAVRTGSPPALAQVGLAESLIGLGQRDDACRLIRQVRDATGEVDARARRVAASCP